MTPVSKIVSPKMNALLNLEQQMLDLLALRRALRLRLAAAHRPKGVSRRKAGRPSLRRWRQV